jgi:hypothetical protein
MKKNFIPTDTSSFDGIILSNQLYVDKTEQILLNILMHKKKYCFFVRPRRFGKSLLCSTLANLFAGTAVKPLFKGLWIDQPGKWDFEQEQSPVIHLDMSSAAGTDPTKTNCKILIEDMLIEIAESYGVSIDSVEALDIQRYFSILIKRLKQKFKRNVVIIIDEYDKPILDLLDHPQKMEEVRAVLQTFYSVLKPQEYNIRLCFITGLMKFSETSMFSSLNNLNDLTFKYESGTLVGYTESELEKYFDIPLSSLSTTMAMSRSQLVQELKSRYDGYVFGIDTASSRFSEHIYNPFAINRVLDEQSIDDDYWGRSGSARKLAAIILEKSNSSFSLTKFLTCSMIKLKSSTSPTNLDITSLLYYGGYATLDSYNPTTSNIQLRVPNETVSDNIKMDLIEELFGSENAKTTNFANLLARFVAVLRTSDESTLAADLQEVLKQIIAEYPHANLNSESSFRNIIDTILKISFHDLLFEHHTIQGRSDTVIKIPTGVNTMRILIIEYKYIGSALKALRQIKDMEYYVALRGPGVVLFGVGLSLSKIKRSVKVVAEQLV